MPPLSPKTVVACSFHSPLTPKSIPILRSANYKISSALFKTEHSPELAAYYADQTYASWMRDPRNTYRAWSEQIVSSRAQGSRYYLRGVTSPLSLNEGHHA